MIMPDKIIITITMAAYVLLIAKTSRPGYSERIVTTGMNNTTRETIIARTVMAIMATTVYDDDDDNNEGHIDYTNL